MGQIPRSTERIFLVTAILLNVSKLIDSESKCGDFLTAFGIFLLLVALTLLCYERHNVGRTPVRPLTASSLDALSPYLVEQF